ncbi:hypothetical protein [Shewanella livingstonensis]|uniref:Uncharacterized protein n=1 Tax=Shewanella livingstonensis TaxID=150120 RepID=A0A3G8LW42_9GAMM|nr:hypothetical protein [Shewanella livingstonensis]AZG73876.1 hypothetical protein EGC82_14585 [Shewanella livingstonensis]
MKNTLLLCLFCLLMTPHLSHAKAGLISFGGESIVPVVELPNDQRFQTQDGEYIDVGYIYKSVDILFLPLWNYDGRFVGMLSQQDLYIDLTPLEVTGLALEAGVVLPKAPYLDFWHRIGGKIVFLLLCGALAIYVLQRMQKKVAYFSPLATGRERLKDILINSNDFVELDLAVIETEGKPKVEGVAFIAAKKYFNNVISISVMDMSKVSIEQVQAQNEQLFTALLGLKKTLGIKSQSTIHYLYFTFDSSPSNADISALKTLRKRQITKATNLIPIIIDFDAQMIDSSVGVYPSKKILQNCFTQADIHSDEVAEPARV